MFPPLLLYLFLVRNTYYNFQFCFQVVNESSKIGSGSYRWVYFLRLFVVFCLTGTNPTKLCFSSFSDFRC